MEEKIVVLDRGNLEFLYPKAWKMEGSRDGYLVFTDPEESCRLEITYTSLLQEMKQLSPELLLKQLIKNVPEASANEKIYTISNGTVNFAWLDYAYPSTNKHTGNEAEAHGRWLLGSNGLFQLLMTFYYWIDDSSWAVPAWERILETIQLGDGSQLQSPKEHWSLRDKN